MGLLCMLMQIKKIFCKHNTSTIDVNIVACFSTGFRGNCMRPHGVEKQEKYFFFVIGNLHCCMFLMKLCNHN